MDGSYLLIVNYLMKINRVFSRFSFLLFHFCSQTITEENFFIIKYDQPGGILSKIDDMAKDYNDRDFGYSHIDIIVDTKIIDKVTNHQKKLRTLRRKSKRTILNEFVHESQTVGGILVTAKRGI